ncbi:MAG: DNA adenine methylase [Acidobacteriota bacterium]|nr:DNA adenine methylase [Acidobacteriota bacterium]
MIAAEATPTRPVLRYHGGKFGKAGVLADWILAHVPPHECYVEPFGGGASVLLRKPRTPNEVYNDLYGEVCTLFRVLRDPELCASLVRSVSLTPFSEAELRSCFGPPDGLCEVEAARRLLVRSWMTIGHDAATSYRHSGFRGGTKTAVRDPGLDWRGLPESLARAADRLQGVHVYERPYEYVLNKYDGPRTAFYVDPPYLRETRSAAHRGAYAVEMDGPAHERLAARLHALEGMVTLSGYDSDLYRSLYPGWRRVERKVFANGRGGVKPGRTEVLWLNAAAAAALESSRPQMRLL